jgi:hypothetical protein
LGIFEGGPLAAKEIGCADEDDTPSFEGQRANSIATLGFGRATAAGPNQDTCHNFEPIMVEAPA